MKRWRCTICNYVHEGDAPPERCPICNAPASKFVEIESVPDKAESKAPKVSKTAPKAEPAKGLDKIKDLTLKYHLHPISVHFPNGILPVVVVLFILAFLSGNVTMAKAGFYNLVFVLLSLPVVLLAGVVAWQKKYRSALTKLFQIKIAAATVTAVLCLVTVVWFLLQPDVISSSGAWVFIAVNVVMLSSAGVAGFIGGKLVFKD
ncbi:MAG: rubredoxin [Desulfobacterium sp.]|jgi:rubredoxin/uncharacterized membrane protein|nr:rubredoxin [Desulfobacterium sp.]